MKSLINSINTNCCYEAMIKNKSEKELSFDIRSKSFSIVDISHIRKNYQKHQFIETSLKRGQSYVQKNDSFGYNQKAKIQNAQTINLSSNQTNSPLYGYCQKASKIIQQQAQIDVNQKLKGCQEQIQKRQLNNFQRTQDQIRRQKIEITCGKRNQIKIEQTRKRLSLGQQRIDGYRKIKNTEIIDSSLKSKKEIRLSIQIHPKLQNYSQIPQYLIENRLLNKQNEKYKLSPCTTTIQNSQSEDFFNKPSINVKNYYSKVQKTQQIYSKVTALSDIDLKTQVRQSFGQADKENEMKMINRATNSNTALNKNIYKGQSYNNYQAKTNKKQQKVTESILSSKDQSIFRQVNSSIISQIVQPQTSIDVIKKQIGSLQKQYGQLKIQQSFLLNKLKENHNQFEVRYQLLLEKKAQCQIQERKRRQEIGEIKKIIRQRAKQLNGNQLTY